MAVESQLITQKPLTLPMSITEACPLALRAAKQEDRGSVYVLDMGNPVRVLDVAKQMIELSGHESKVVGTGFPPGEKLHEVLSSDSEKLQDSDYPLVKRLRSGIPTPNERCAIQEKLPLRQTGKISGIPEDVS